MSQRPSLPLILNCEPAPSTPWQKQLPSPLQPAGAGTVDIHLVSGDSTEHGHTQGLWCQHVPLVNVPSHCRVWPSDPALYLGAVLLSQRPFTRKSRHLGSTPFFTLSPPFPSSCPLSLTHPACFPLPSPLPSLFPINLHFYKYSFTSPLDHSV